jgi:hypothetical protein
LPRPHGSKRGLFMRFKTPHRLQSAFPPRNVNVVTRCWRAEALVRAFGASSAQWNVYTRGKDASLGESCRRAFPSMAISEEAQVSTEHALHVERQRPKGKVQGNRQAKVSSFRGVCVSRFVAWRCCHLLRGRPTRLYNIVMDLQLDCELNVLDIV